MVLDAPTFEEVASELLTKLDGKIFVAHNAHFDYSFLKREFEMAGLAWQAHLLAHEPLGLRVKREGVTA